MQKVSGFFVFLFLISCLGQISSDLYLPALPTLLTVFHTSENAMQFTLAMYMFGFSLSQLVYGPISDYRGRKKPLLIGMSICAIGTALCLFSTHIAMLIFARFLQGVGAGAGAALFLCILRDRYEGNALARVSSFINISRVILLACSPLIGSYLLHFFNWQACFAFLLFYTMICWFGTVFLFEETNQQRNQNHLTLMPILRDIRYLLTHRIFMSNAFCVMLAFGGILAWLTTLPFLLQNEIGLTPVEFGWISALSGLFFIVGGVINALWVERKGMQTMLGYGLYLMMFGSVIMLFFGMLAILNTVVIMVPVIIYILGSSFIFSNAYAGAMDPFSKMAGTAAATFGFLQILGGAISSTIMASLKNYNQVPLALILFMSALIAFLCKRSVKAA